MQTVDRTATVAQIVVQHPAAARVFQKHGIDYCCRGNVGVPEASSAHGLDPEALFTELEAALPASPVSLEDDPRQMTTAALVARIVDRYHGYLWRTLPYLEPLVAKVARVHGAKNPKLVELKAVFERLSAALIPHLDQEEAVLFPALVSRTPDRALIASELASMHEDHLTVGAMLGEIRSLADAFTTPEWGCTSYRVLMTELEGLEASLLEHVHTENHVLMPRFAAAGAGGVRAA
ncbi:MAG TPA: iron-sulfur cluster repair di-iron protein [Anaeromyxobacteraceae bacterium]|nr:iron-sulfur cluster repair di-iron protein [Anaeromyxobacteraceae bacterium]